MFKKRRQKGFLRALLCCFFRPEVAQEAQKPIQDVGTEVSRAIIVFIDFLINDYQFSIFSSFSGNIFYLKLQAVIQTNYA